MPALRQRLKNFFIEANRVLSATRSEQAIHRATGYGYLATFIIAAILLALPLVQKVPEFAEGEIAAVDVLAAMDLRLEDVAETERLRREAYSRERPVFDRDFMVLEKIQQQLATEVAAIVRTAEEKRSLAERSHLLKERMPWLSDRLYSESAIKELLSEKKPALLERFALELAERVFAESGFLAEPIPQPVLLEILQKGAHIRTINAPRELPDLVWSAEKLYNPQKMFVPSLPAEIKLGELKPGSARILLARIVQLMRENPQLRYNPHASEMRRRQAMARVSPVYRQVRKGTVLLRAGEVVDSEKQKLLQQVRDYHRRHNGAQFAGIVLIMGVMTAAVVFFTSRFAWQQVADYASHIILHLLFVMLFVIELLLLVINPLQRYEVNFIFFVPLGFFGILAGQFFGARVTISAGIYLAIFSYLLTGFDREALLLALGSTLSGLYAATRMQRRSHILRGLWIVATTNLVLIAGFELLAPSARNFELKAAAVLTSSVLSILLALGVLPLLEFIFNLPTPFRLMELNDFNHPLLVKMAAIAPSTHSHSVMMANLSEAAVRAIGGDTLLTRVGCLYHDIGKLLHPEFYAENRHLYPESETFRNLDPYQSAQMIIRHVSDGIAMARDWRLPEKVIHFIPEHHGTTTIQYFYHKALENHRRGDRIPQRRDFQYPGPRPQSRETAVVMLADSVEAASRALEGASPADFAAVIDRIIQNKIAEEQLHDAPLTLGDLAQVRKAFLEVLVGTYHERPQYPTREQTRALEVSVHAEAKRGSGARARKKKEHKLPRLID